MKNKQYTLKQIREQLGITQTTLANKLDISTVNYNRLENRHTKPSYKTMQNISKVIKPLDIGIENVTF